jgi:hypothetical protein
VGTEVLLGHKRIALAITDPGAGSDVAKIAVRPTNSINQGISRPFVPLNKPCHKLIKRVGPLEIDTGVGI